MLIEYLNIKDLSHGDFTTIDYSSVESFTK